METQRTPAGGKKLAFGVFCCEACSEKFATLVAKEACQLKSVKRPESCKLVGLLVDRKPVFVSLCSQNNSFVFS